MTYSIKEIFYTLQGEGIQSGRPAVFCRFAGCNLWTGREEDRSTAICNFCDTDFIGTNGTIPVPEGIDWICVSPKSGADWVQKTGHELKLIYPQIGLLPHEIQTFGFQYYLLQPMDNILKRQNTIQAIKYCQSNPKWRLSVQTHKVLEIR